jgi:hypothetical protein
MLATGGLLVSIALLTLALLVPIFHRSDPPRWTTRGWIGEVVTVSIVCTLALGLGCLGAGTIDAFQTGPDYIDLGLLAGVLLITVVIWRRLNARARPGALAADAMVRAPAPASADTRSGGGVATAEPVQAAVREPSPPHRAA